ncbi:MAG: bacteriohemerythrin [Magnetospiraceae bacterium]
MRFEISKEWVVGHPQIDADHRELAVHLNGMFDAAELRDFDLLDERMAVFLKLLKHHFIRENQIMIASGFDVRIGHAFDHQKQLKELQAVFEEHRENAPQLAALATDVFIRKILQHDLYFRDFLARKQAVETAGVDA